MQIIKRDITTIRPPGLVIHGVNCQGVMNSGVAKAIRNKWPRAYEAFKNIGPNKDMLGICHTVCISEDLFVGNCYTQEFYGREKKRYASPEAIEHALEAAYIFAEGFGIPLHSPMIGCGLGGLDWSEVGPIYEKVSSNYNVETFIYTI